jgi:hypothetical protein
MESTTLQNAIIIPPQILTALLSTITQPPTIIALAILNEMHCLDMEIKAKPSLESTKKEKLELLDLSDTLLPEFFIDNCSYIIQWLYLIPSNRIKPVRYSPACQRYVQNWYNKLHKNNLLHNTSSLTKSQKNLTIHNKQSNQETTSTKIHNNKHHSTYHYPNPFHSIADHQPPHRNEEAARLHA